MKPIYNATELLKTVENNYNSEKNRVNREVDACMAEINKLLENAASGDLAILESRRIYAPCLHHLSIKASQQIKTILTNAGYEILHEQPDPTKPGSNYIVF